ncbi:MAG: DnaJ domain-containing protein [Nitrospinales bacterium]
MRPQPKDYYKILAIPENAGEVEIKKAFRKLAMEFHPDHNRGDPECEEKFKEISEAYGVLIDPTKRREYDRYRSGAYSGAYSNSSRFNYSQQDIFESIFRNAFSRDIFEDLNREFSQSGVRSGPSFFQKILFGGATSGLARLLWLLPGPLGRIGQVLRLVQMAASSLSLLNRMQKSKGVEGGENPLLDSIKGLFGATKTTSAASSLDIELQIALPQAEAQSGAKKELAYKIDGEGERLRISIPPGVASGQKLRIKEKGYKKNGRRGDLILSIRVE